MFAFHEAKYIYMQPARKLAPLVELEGSFELSTDPRDARPLKNMSLS